MFDAQPVRFEPGWSDNSIDKLLQRPFFESEPGRWQRQRYREDGGSLIGIEWRGTVQSFVPQSIPSPVAPAASVREVRGQHLVPQEKL